MISNTLPARIAWRYLRAPKSHSAVSAISVISVVGVAVATAAIICVLSVFNGFRSILSDKLDILAPDVMVTPAVGKTFTDGDSVANVIAEVSGVDMALPAVVDNALAIVDGREMPITLRGVDFQRYPELTRVDSIITGGRKLASLDTKDVVASVGVARQLGFYNGDVPMLIFAPRREGRVNMANPMASFLTDSVNVADIFQAMQTDYDENNVICDISVARDLFQYDAEATAIEVKATPGTDVVRLGTEISNRLGPDFTVKDRYRQQEMNFRMVEIEKWVTFLILIFILVIASFNIVSTLCMLVLEKQQSMATLLALGLSRRKIGGIFWWESMYVALIGGISGVILGLALCLLQEYFGLIRLGGDPSMLVIQAYPVKVEFMDIIYSLIPVILIGLCTAWTASAFARSRLSALPS
ncbi:MAG: ABC transporter permease [Muribaculaceae bacterium]|nr:ABC transporter permease [Muribaculaceae bacterium]